VGRRSGRNNAHQRDTTLTNDEYLRWSAPLPSRGPQSCLVSQKILSIYKERALAGRADLRDDQPPELLRPGLGGRVWHSLDLPEGYHTPARWQSQTTHVPVLSRAAPGLPCGRASPDRSATTATWCRSVAATGCPGGRVEPFRCRIEVGQRLTLLVEIAGTLRRSQSLERIADVGDGLAHILIGGTGTGR
jgi:hypothetical protein